MDNGGLGILGGLSQGLAEGFKTYLQTQNMLEEQAMKKRLANAQSIDAISKLAAVGGTDYADQKAKDYGLLLDKPVQYGQEQAQAGSIPMSGAQMPKAGLLPSPGSAPQQQPMSAPMNAQSGDIVDRIIQSPERFAPAVREMHKEEINRRLNPLDLEKQKVELQNAKNAGLNEGVSGYEGNEVIKQSREVNTSYNIMNQHLKGGDPASDKDFLMAYVNIMREGKVPRGTDPETLKVKDESAYARYKEIADTMINNKIPESKKMEMMSAASKHMVGMGQEVSGIQNRFRELAKSRNASDPTVGEPFMGGLKSANNYLKSNPNIEPVTMMGDLKKSGFIDDTKSGAQGLVTAGKDALNAFNPSMKADQTTTQKAPSSDELMKLKKFVKDNPTDPRSVSIKAYLNGR